MILKNYSIKVQKNLWARGIMPRNADSIPRVRVEKMKGAKAGLRIKDDVIIVDPKTLRSGSLLPVIVHELVHYHDPAPKKCGIPYFESQHERLAFEVQQTVTPHPDYPDEILAGNGIALISKSAGIYGMYCTQTAGITCHDEAVWCHGYRVVARFSRAALEHLAAGTGTMITPGGAITIKSRRDERYLAETLTGLHFEVTDSFRKTLKQLLGLADPEHDPDPPYPKAA